MSCGRGEAAFARLTRSTSVRLSAWYFAVFIVSVALLAGVTDRYVAAAVAERERRALADELDAVGERWRSGGAEGLHEACLPSDATFVRVSDESSRTVFVRGPDAALVLRRERVVERDALGRTFTTARSDLDGEAWSLASRQEGDGGSIEVGRSRASVQAQLAALRESALLTLALALIVGLAGGALVTHRALKPVRQLATVTREILSSGDLGLRVPVRGSGDDLDELARQYNRLLQKNESLVDSMRHALDDVAHDLRTPLARTRASAELALRPDTVPDDMREALADTVEETDQVLSMLRSLMEISEAEAGVLQLAREDVDLSETAREVRDTYDHVAEDKGLRILLDSDGPIFASADRTRIRQAVANLVDNAIKYSEPGGVVEIATRSDAEHAQISVRDTGIGIAPEEHERIFGRLYRVDPSRSRPGLGLGLSLVRAIAQAHGGFVRVDSAPGAGSVFTLVLPRRQPDSLHASPHDG